MLHSRLPTTDNFLVKKKTDNLIKRYILQHNAQLCVGRCGMMENT